MHNSIMSKDFQHHLAIAIQEATQVNILSPYLTMAAVEYLFQHLPLGVHTKIIVRARPQDILSGSVDINALNILHESGIKCFLHRTLHGKFYQINEDEGYIGSANFTSNGLCLSGYGNLELTLKVKLSTQDQSFIASIFQTAIPITNEIIKEMIAFSLRENKDLGLCPAWWDNLLPIINYIPENDGLYVGDLPWCNFSTENTDVDIEHDKDIFSFGKPIKEMRNEFLQSKVFLFIIDKLKKCEHKNMYFGELSKLIHSSLRDDLLPYRKEVKGYVINLLTYIENLVPDKIAIDRPNYSQRISLKF